MRQCERGRKWPKPHGSPAKADSGADLERKAEPCARDALASIEAAHLVLAGTGSVLLARADELEALVRLSLGDSHTPADLAGGLPAVRRGLLLARIALAYGDQRAAGERLQALPLEELTPRCALARQILLAAAAIERGDPGPPAPWPVSFRRPGAGDSSIPSSPPPRR